jgi:Kelch motif/Galactose oxidase, central domain
MKQKVLRNPPWRGSFGVALLCAVLAGCGVSPSKNQEDSTGSFYVFPDRVTVRQGDVQHFSAWGRTNKNVAVTWSIQEGTAGGTVSNAGDYTAPKTAGTYHIVAVSMEDPTQSATATVAVPSVSVKISPASDNLGLGQQRQFFAEVTGTVEKLGLTWSVLEGAAGGTITSEGLYTAPATAGTYHVELSSTAGTVTNGESTVTILSSGYFQPTGSMQAARAEHTSTLLQNGKVLVAGGTDGNTDLRTAELYDPATDTFSPTGDMVQARRDHTATLLENGRVLIAGGKSPSTNTENAAASAELYDPTTGTFTSTGVMTAPGSGTTATLLTDGRVLVAGGDHADLYDPATGTFTKAANLAAEWGRIDHAAVRLADGRVLLAGGQDFNDVLRTAETYDPTSGRFTFTGNMNTFRAFLTLSLLPDGNVLAAGGMTDGACRYACKPIQDVDLYDPATGLFMALDEMHAPHGGHTATVLSNGNVLIVGGKTFTVELYDPASETFFLTGSLTTERTFHTATLLKDGRVLATGGYDGAQHPLTSAEVYK